MRVWLVDDKNEASAGSLEAVLRQLEERPGTGLCLLGASPFQPDFPASMRKLVPELLDLLVIHERFWPEGPWTEDVLSLGVGMVVVTSSDRLERFRALADRYPISFVPPTPGLETLWLALVGTLAGQHRQTYWKEQASRLQQRLSDRIIIERAKGILVQRLKISEEDAYKRLRVLSRRQRRQIRDIAQSLLDLDTQFLFSPPANGPTGQPDEPKAALPENSSPGE
jgi:hypothetical protein